MRKFYHRYLLKTVHTLFCGQSLVEILLAIAISGVVLPVLFTAFFSSREGKAQQQLRTDAVALVNEAQQAIRTLRESSWDLISINGTYHPVSTASAWMLVPGSETINNFTRKVDIENVYRDNNGKIVENGGTLDPSTKKITVSVTWTTPYNSALRSTMYLTRYLNNSSYIETSEAQFRAGFLTNVAVTNTSGGEVVLGSGGQGDWCAPELSTAELDMPKQGVASSLSAYEGRAIVGTGQNASGISLADIHITNTNPPVASIAGVVDGYKTNDVFLDGNYAYIATDNNSKEVVIIDLTNYREVGYFNTPANDDATSVYVSGNYGYVTAGFWLYRFDLSSKIGSRPQVGSPYYFLGIATSVVVNGNYAYVSLASSLIEMQIMDISNPQRFTNTGWADVNGTDGKRIFVNPSATRAYLATSASASRSEFFIIDISSKSGSRPTIGSYDSSGMNPKNLTVVPGNKAILVGTNGEEYQVIDISNERNPVRCGGLNINTGVNNVAGVLEADGDAYAYIVTGDSQNEFKIIEGGPGGRYASEGIFESITFDAGRNVAFNRFVSNVDKPLGTDIKLQIAVAESNGGSCNGAVFRYIGPDGTPNSYYTSSDSTIEGTVPPIDSQGYKNPGRCFRYKVFLSTTDQTRTPTFYDLSVNYSP